MKLGYSTNNVYNEYPPIMNDGRTIIASHQPESIINNYLLKELGIKSNWEYRKYIIENGKDIMKYNCMNVSNDVGFSRRNEMSMSVSVSSSEWIESSDLKTMYMSREELNNRSAYSYNTQEELLKYR
jgi:hypothetical protein